MKKNNNDKITIHRSSVTGRFVTEKYTKSHPNTTQTEHRQKPKK